MPELYDNLEVSPTATKEEIKRSYFRLVRRFPPEKEPERFKVIRTAYETLSDSKLREEYDTLESYGSEMTELLDVAQEQINAGQWGTAVESLKKLIVLAPQQEVAWNMLGICLTSLDRYDEAEKAFKRILSMNSDSGVAHANLGFLWNLRSEERSGVSPNQQCLNIAIEHFIEACRLTPLNSEYPLYVAQAYSKMENHQKAWEWTETSIQVNDQEDFQDLDALMFLVRLCFALDQKYRVSDIVKRIKKVLPDDAEARQYAANRFTEILLEAIDAEAYEIAGIVADSILKMNADMSELNDKCRAIRTVGKVNAEISRMMDDSQIVQPIKRFALFFHMRDIGKEVPDGESFFEDAMPELDLLEHNSIVNSVRYLRSNYKSVFDSNRDFYDHIERVIRDASNVNNAQPGPPYPQSAASQTLSAWPSAVSAARELGIRIENVVGSGANGRVTVKDVEAYHRSKGGAIPTAPIKATSSADRNNGSSNNNSDECFVATAVFQSRANTTVIRLRRFRDHFLTRYQIGRLLICVYNYLGPGAAILVHRFPILRTVLRPWLAKLSDIANFLTR